MACGFVINMFLARWFTPSVYGLYGLVMSILLWAEYTVLDGIPSTYRKVISEDENSFDSVLHSIKWTFLPYCLTILAVFSIVSFWLSRPFNDNRLSILLLIAGIDIPVYGMYGAYLSIINGYRKFAPENIIKSLYSISKVTLIILLTLLGFGLRGVLVSNMLASLCGLLIAFSFVKSLRPLRNKRKIVDLKPRIITFGLPYLLYGLTSMLLIHMDIWFIKGLLTDDAAIGYYTIAGNLSRPLFFLMTGILSVVFPSFSKLASEGNLWFLQKYIKQAMRLALFFLCPLVIMLSITSEELISFLFTTEYLPASSSLKLLLLGTAFFSIFSLFLTIIAAKNKPFYSFIVSLGLIPIAVSLNYLLITSHGIEGAALTTTLVSGIGAIITGVYLWRRIGAIVNVLTLGRIIGATGIMYLISRYIYGDSYYLIIKYLILSLTYIGVLVLSKEINFGDLSIIKETLMRIKMPRL